MQDEKKLAGDTFSYVLPFFCFWGQIHIELEGIMPYINGFCVWKVENYNYPLSVLRTLSAKMHREKTLNLLEKNMF